MSKSDHIKIIKPGILSTLQDAGRPGYRAIGIGPGGVMDRYAFNIANRLLGNDPNCVVIEMHFPAPVIEFHTNTKRRFCLTGADFGAILNHRKIATWEVFEANEGDILSFEGLLSGFRCYLAVEGGFEAENWLGSYSTNLTIGMGGHKGRMLQKEDMLRINRRTQIDEAPEISNSYREERAEIYDLDAPVLCMEGPEWNWLDKENKLKVMSASFKISGRSNRMACLLESPSPVRIAEKKEMLSSAVLMGTVQLLPDGNLAALMADHQTTGGFPRILQILESQLPKLAQNSPNHSISFEIRH